MAKDYDSAGVYFLSIEEFEWRPGSDDSLELAHKKEEARLQKPEAPESPPLSKELR